MNKTESEFVTQLEKVISGALGIDPVAVDGVPEDLQRFRPAASPDFAVPFSGPAFETITMKEAMERADAQFEADLNAIGMTFNPEKVAEGFRLFNPSRDDGEAS